MNIQVGEVKMIVVDTQTIKSSYPIKNRTQRYLLPSLAAHGKEFSSKLNNVFKIAVGIGDVIKSNAGIIHEKHLFILLDGNIATAYFTNFIYWIRKQPMYEDDYVFGNIQTSSLHIVVVKLPEKFYDVFPKFNAGRYSELFKQEDIEAYFTSTHARAVLLKDHNYHITFAKRLVKRLNLEYDLDLSNYIGELDLVPNIDAETFNHHLKK